MNKNIIMGVTLGILISTGVAAATNEIMPKVERPTADKALAARQERMAERYSKMDQEKLIKRKEMLENRIQKETNEKRKEFLEIELKTINELIAK